MFPHPPESSAGHQKPVRGSKSSVNSFADSQVSFHENLLPPGGDYHHISTNVPGKDGIFWLGKYIPCQATPSPPPPPCIWNCAGGHSTFGAKEETDFSSAQCGEALLWRNLWPVKQLGVLCHLQLNESWRVQRLPSKYLRPGPGVLLEGGTSGKCCVGSQELSPYWVLGRPGAWGEGIQPFCHCAIFFFFYPTDEHLLVPVPSTKVP